MAKRSYSQFCPTAKSLDLLGERWTLLIVRELLRGPLRYTDLADALPGMWNNLLGQRLRDLMDLGLVEQQELPPPAARTVYALTERGRELQPVIYELARFGLPYLGLPSDDEPMTDALAGDALLALALVEHLPPPGFRAVVDLGERVLGVEVTGDDGPLIGRLRVSEPPEFDSPDVRVEAELPALLWVRRGDMTVREAVEARMLRVEGEAGAVGAFARLYGFDTVPA